MDRSPDNSAWSSVTTTSLNAAAYVDSNLGVVSTYYYRLSAVNTADVPNESQYSNTASTRTNAVAVPIAPSGFSGFGLSKSTVSWTWTDNSNNEAGFRVYSDTGGPVSPVLSINASYWIESGITSTGVCRFVAAFNSAGASSSTVVCVTFDKVKPKHPKGISGNFVSSKDFKITWEAPSANEDETALTDLGGYRIYRVSGDALKILSVTQYTQTVGTSTLTWTDTLDDLSVDYFYVVRTVDTSGNESGNSVIIDTSKSGMATIMSSDGGVLVKVPKSITSQADVTFTPNTSEVGGKVLASYVLKAIARDGTVLTDIGATVVMRFVIGAGAPSSALRAVSLPGGQAAQQLAVFYFNGFEHLKLGGAPAADGKTLDMNISRFGAYQVRQAYRAADFNIISVEPRKTFTPNGDCINDYFTIRFDNPKDSIISGLVFDMTGREVADFKAIEANADSCTTSFSVSSISWDGKDRNGNPVDAGVYFYQVKTSEGVRKSGTIVIAR